MPGVVIFADVTKISRLNEGHFAKNWLPWQRPLSNRKKTGPD